MVRHCPRCRADYRPEIVTCGHCGGELEARDEEYDPRFEPPPPVGPGPERPTPPGLYESLYFTYDLPDLVPLTERLTARGVPFRIEATETAHGAKLPRTRFDLTVREEERDAALGELAEFLGTEGGEREIVAAPSLEGDDGRCPACGEPVGADAPECPGCGLALIAG